jgi:hypothetical protein
MQKQNPISQREMGFCFLWDMKIGDWRTEERWEDWFVKIKDLTPDLTISF